MFGSFQRKQTGRWLKGRAARPVGFSIAGVGSFSVDFALFNLMLLASFDPSAANLVSYLISILANFLLNRRVFSHRKSVVIAGAKFMGVAGGSVLFVFFVFEVFLHIAEAPTLVQMNIVRSGALAVGAVLRFVMFSKWVFR